MTIKKRLVISNILMIVIPVAIALVSVLIGMTITKSLMNEVKDNKQQTDASADKVYDLVVRTLDTGRDSSKLEKVLNAKKMSVVVYDDKGHKYQYGQRDLKYQEALLNAGSIIDDEGVVTINKEEVHKENRKWNDTNYTIYLLYSDLSDELAYNQYHMRLTIVIIITIISVILAIIITNHFLTHFIFRKIKQSLDLLANGVHEISDGNLDYRSVYTENDEFAPINQDFNNMAAQLKQSVELTQKQEQSRKELLAGISHDLRSPLTSIKAYVEGLLDGVAKTPETQTSYMRVIKTKAEDIDRMVSKLFLFSKMDLGNYPYDPEIFDLTQELTCFVEAMKEEYEAMGLKISIEHMEPGITIYADPVQMRSIFVNILENSLKYNNKDQAKAVLIVQREGQVVRILIDDNGPGVPEQALDKLFDVFYRSDPSRSNPNMGSGLGLAIVSKSVSKMDGNIHAENLEQGGLRMVIELPIAVKEEDDEENINH